MSARTAPRSSAGSARSGAARPSKAARAQHRRRRRAARRRGAVLVAATLLAAMLAVLVVPAFQTAVKEVALPLRHDDIVRQQADDKDLDPSLVAAVIYAESRFVEGRTSSAGAKGLMQVTPATAQDIARRSGATTFEVSDLDTPQVNIAYGTFHLRFLLDHYGGNELLAVAAYNAGQGNVDRWIARDPGLRAENIPFPETREYVKKVLDVRGDYRTSYADELGI
jgi:soluble lytic murein transglycosylase